MSVMIFFILPICFGYCFNHFDYSWHYDHTLYIHNDITGFNEPVRVGRYYGTNWWGLPLTIIGWTWVVMVVLVIKKKHRKTQ